MKAKPVRVVLAFYSAEEGHAEGAYRALQRSEKVCLAGGDLAGLDPLCRRYYGLRLEGESLVVVETEESRLDAVIQALRLEGSPAIFTVRPDFGPDQAEPEE